MHRFYIDERMSVGGEAYIKGPEARHVKDVLRLKVGDKVVLFDGSGMEFSGEITGIARDQVSVDILEGKEGETESPIEIILGQGIPKSDKMDLIVQKSTELGVSKIVPIFTERVVPKSFSPNKLERWRRIAIEACKQSGRVTVPEVLEPIRFEEFVKNADIPSLCLIPWEEEKETSLEKVLPAALISGKVTLIVGPEGGLAGPEIELARRGGFTPVSLGKRILRTETVSISLLSIIQYLYGDLAGD
ncbi:MAG TPA: 16S rRNA (uracil(1498)-N(3))-methyltransferase [Thermodesulfobacteriota bacterium]|nr:16S rRNA (uracil(1498)-N(3))-methyltransferase [Thermodesulfobacteriota bacterium]